MYVPVMFPLTCLQESKTVQDLNLGQSGCWAVTEKEMCRLHHKDRKYIRKGKLSAEQIGAFALQPPLVSQNEQAVDSGVYPDQQASCSSNCCCIVLSLQTS